MQLSALLPLRNAVPRAAQFKCALNPGGALSAPLLGSSPAISASSTAVDSHPRSCYNPRRLDMTAMRRLAHFLMKVTVHS
jgi:hypothetical protein